MAAPWNRSPPGSKISPNALGIHVDLDELRARLQAMSDAKLLTFGRQMRELCYPLTYDGDGKPSVSAFSIQLDEARAEWRRRNPKHTDRIASYSWHADTTLLASSSDIGRFSSADSIRCEVETQMKEAGKARV